jgi:hypothetical protein
VVALAVAITAKSLGLHVRVDQISQHQAGGEDSTAQQQRRASHGCCLLLAAFDACISSDPPDPVRPIIGHRGTKDEGRGY